MLLFELKLPCKSIVNECIKGGMNKERVLSAV